MWFNKNSRPAAIPDEPYTNCPAGWGYVVTQPRPISPVARAGASRVPTNLGLPYYGGLDQAIPPLQVPRQFRSGIAAQANLRNIGEPFNYDRFTLKLPRYSQPTRGTRATSLNGPQSAPSRMSQAAIPPVFYPTTWR